MESVFSHSTICNGVRIFPFYHLKWAVCNGAIFLFKKNGFLSTCVDREAVAHFYTLFAEINCARQYWVHLSAVRDHAESSWALFGTALIQSWKLSVIALSQVDSCPRQRLSTVQDNVEESWELSMTAVSHTEAVRDCTESLSKIPLSRAERFRDPAESKLSVVQDSRESGWPSRDGATSSWYSICPDIDKYFHIWSFL